MQDGKEKAPDGNPGPEGCWTVTSIQPPGDPWEGRPVAQSIVTHLCELSAEYRAAKDPGRQRALLKRINSLEHYLIVPLSHGSRKIERDRMVLGYARILMTRGGNRTWNELKAAVDDYRRRISVRPKGRPIEYCNKVAEALECKCAHPSKSWREIASELRLESSDLKREVRRFRAVCRRERIQLPSRTP
jgi:hypothetical protein